MEERVTRRDFVRLAGGATAFAAGGGLGAFLEACGGSASQAPSKPVEKDVTKLYAAARKEGSVTWWTAHYEQSAAETMAASFKKKYPGVDVNLLRQTAQVLYTRLQNDLKAGQTECDVFASTDEGHYPPLKKAGALATFTPPDVDLLPKEFQVLDPDHQYYLGAIGFVLINYRTDKVPTPPKSWKDLLDPQWKGKITTGHPGFSGYVGNWVIAMIDKYGDSYLKDLEKNSPKINRSVNDTVTDIVQGERQVGAGPDGIMKGSQRPNAAQLFVNFMYSKEYSEALVSTSNYPLRADIKPVAGTPTLDKIKWHRNKVDRLITGVPEAIQKWREIMGV